jgi:hypothetical protein
MAQTFTARQTAIDVVKACKARGVERAVNAKRVRAFVRDTVPGYDDGQYTAHLYDARLHERIVKAMVARYTAGRPASASLGRSTPAQTPRKPATARKPASKPASPSATPADAPA